MGLKRIAIGVSTLLASLMLVPVAAAETVVPPGNGAATQYTEAFPTSGGNAVGGDEINGGGGGGKHSTPSHVLGHDNAKKLEEEGQVGRETARVAAESAPPQAGEESSAGAAPAASGSGGPPHNGASAAKGGKPEGSGQGGNVNVRDNALEPQSTQSGDGSSGFTEVIGQATGSSSGESGLLLPLILVAAVVASFAYAWRRRRVAH